MNTNASPEEVYQGLRARALSTNPLDIGLKPGEGAPPVWGALMELGYPKAVATILSLADSTTSFYLSTGGGVIGGGGREEIRRAGQAFLGAAGKLTEHFESTQDFPLPKAGQVRFQLLTFSGGLTAVDDEKKVQNKNHPLFSLYALGQDIITEFRLFDEGKQGDTRWEGEPGYVNCLLTALVEGTKKSVVLSSKGKLPPLLSVAEGDEHLIDWLRRLKMDYERLNPEIVTDMIMKSAGLSHLNFLKKRGVINVVLAPKSDAEKPKPFPIMVEKTKGKDGEPALRIWVSGY